MAQKTSSRRYARNTDHGSQEYSRNSPAPWIFAPNTVALNQDTSFLKILAMITMFIDHAGKMLFPQYRILRLIGRIAFPIYAYCLAAGMVYTRNPLSYLKRLLLLALISQPLYVLALGHTTMATFLKYVTGNPVLGVLNFYIYSWLKPSILVTLTFSMILLWALREKQITCAIAVGVLIWLIQNSLDYGVRGVGLVLLFYIFISQPLLSFPVVTAYMIWWGFQNGGAYTIFGFKLSTQFFAVLALPFIYMPMKKKFSLPKWISYGFYPLHLILIYVLDHYLMK